MNNKRQEFYYGRMGEVIQNIRTFALPNETNTYSFRMDFEYDSWNRIQSTSYPDGEYVRYWYNTGGQLTKMASDYSGVTYNYIDSIFYNKFEKRSQIYYGNGTKAEYNYDILQRLIKLKSTSASGIMQKIDYTFDNVNNITNISNGATLLSNGLGGTYQHSYSYDNMYRLSSSTGDWDNNNNYLSYTLDMQYSDDGRILQKTQSASTLISGNLSSFTYDNIYSYNTGQVHTLSNVYDVNKDQNFEWDANGNLTFQSIRTPSSDFKRRLCWDEENRLMAVGDNNFTSYYVYDNGGERTYKLTGPNTLMNINGNWMNFAYMDNPTLYTSAYLVATTQGYTKHYYAGSERIASAIGLGGLKKVSIPLELHNYEHNWEYKSAALHDEMDRTITECIGNEYNCKKNLEILYHLEDEPSIDTMDRYFYHPDHLGSSSWITDGSGNAIQHLHYLPFGEDWVDQRNSSWNAPYTFSGKEKDAETGYGYFGARYYDSDLSIWLSVDPMAHKYPHQTNFVYCSNNPIRIIDPNGEDEYEFNKSGELINIIKNTEADILRVYDEEGNSTDSDPFAYGTIKKNGTRNYSKTEKYTFFELRGDENGDKMFSFLADNTNVEWGHIKTGIEGQNGLNFLTTSHSDDENRGSMSLFNSRLKGGSYIREWNHNHPGLSLPVPSGMPGTVQEGTGDIAVASFITQHNKNLGYKAPKFNVYMTSYGKNSFTPNSKVSDFQNIYSRYGLSPVMK